MNSARQVYMGVSVSICEEQKAVITGISWTDVLLDGCFWGGSCPISLDYVI